jgi:WD40 repeat protein
MARLQSKSFKLKRAYDLAFAPDAKLVATISRDVLLWDTSARKRLLSVHPLSHPSHLDFSPDGTRLAIKSTSGRIVVIDAVTGETLTDCDNEREGEGAPLYFTPEGDSLVDASWNGALTARHSATGTVIFRESVGGMVSELTTGADRTTFAYTISRPPATNTEPPPEDSIMVRRWPFTANRSSVMPVARRFIRCISLSPSASRLAVLYGAPPKTLEICDVATGRILASAEVELGGSGTSLGWSPGESLLGCVERRGISLFQSATLLRTHLIEMPYPASVSFSPHGGLLGLASWQQGRVLDMTEVSPHELHANVAS